MTHAGRWKKGQSGNPGGRPPGDVRLSELRAQIAVHVPELVEKLLVQAREGDVAAARLLIERVLPPVKATEKPEEVSIPEGSLTEKGNAILAAVSAGQLAPGQGAVLISAIGSLARVVEVDELAARVAALEGAQHGKS